MFEYADHVTKLKLLTAHGLTVDVGSIRAIGILDEILLARLHDSRVVRGHAGIVDLDVVVFAPTNGGDLFYEFMLFPERAIEMCPSGSCAWNESSYVL